MAAHAHTQIRNALAAALTGLASTGSKVYPNRLAAIHADKLPALRVFTDAEAVEATSIHSPAVYQRRLTSVVECCAQGTDTVDDACDQIAKEVEIALASGVSVAGKTLYCTLTGSEYTDELAGLDAGVKRLTFEILFFVAGNAPDVLL